MRLPDPDRSRIILFGTSVHRDAELPDVPVIANNIRDLTAVFTDERFGIVRRGRCHAVLNVASQRQFGKRLLGAARAAEDLLLVYFAGHGLLGPRRRELFLALPNTAHDALAFSALSFDAIRDACLESPATCRVVILDCCYSGRAIADTLSADDGTVLEQIEIGGTYTLTSSPANRTSMIVAGEPYSAFTGRLIGLLQEGIEEGPPLLGLGDIYKRLRMQFAAEGLPLPQQRGTETGDLIALARNRGAATSTTIYHADSTPALRTGNMGTRRPKRASTSQTGDGDERRISEGTEAEQLFEEIIDDRTQILGKTHSDTLTSRHEFAIYLGDRGYWARAVAVLRDVVRDRIDVQGRDNPATLQSQHALAVYLGMDGYHNESIRLFREVIRLRVKVLGKDHRDTLFSRAQLAYRLGRSGAGAESIELYQSVARDRQRVLGPDHPDTLESRHYLAFQISESGDPTQALQLFRSVVSDRARVLGLDHPGTLASRLALASALSKSGNYAEGLKLTEEVVADRTRVLGVDHPDTIAARHQLANLVGDGGDRARSVHLFEQVVLDRTRVRGPSNPDTLSSRAHLANQIGLGGNGGKAVTLLRAVVMDCIEALGADHPLTLGAQFSLAHHIGLAGNHADAVRRLRQVLSSRERVLGKYHPDTLSTRQRLALEIGRSK
jgi:uncharacterized caspase-like protein